MILTGLKIEQSVISNDIIIDPFNKDQINPNSYNFNLAQHILEVSIVKNKYEYNKIELNDEGITLMPNILYLGSTYEIIGSKKYAMTLLGKSSLGRLGLFLNSTADLGHVGSVSQWTLELSVVQPLKIYPNMCIGQVAFWVQKGNFISYRGKYLNDIGPKSSKEF